MMDFPNTPANGDRYTPAGGPTYSWNGWAWLQEASPLSTRTARQRNRIINPAFQINQDNGVITAAGYIADQWRMGLSGLVVAGQIAALGGYVSPEGTTQCGAIAATTAKATLAAGDYLALLQPIEGLETYDLQWGTASAKPAILRFTALADTPGIYGIGIRNSANDRSWCGSFTATSVPTTVVIPIPGDTSGTWLKDTGIGVLINFAHSTGSTYTGVNGWQAGNFLSGPGCYNGATVASKYLRITDVGLYRDADNTGIPPVFEPPPFIDDMMRCLRHYWNMQPAGASYVGWQRNQGDTLRMFYVNYPVPMRASPSMTCTAIKDYAGGSLGMSINSVNNRSGGCYLDIGSATSTLYLNQFIVNARLI